MIKLVNILWNRFGGTHNSKGYRVLNPKVRLLWGDGIDIRGVWDSGSRRVLRVLIVLRGKQHLASVFEC